MLQRDAPLPACIPRRRARVSDGRFTCRARNGNSSVTRQPMTPILVPCVQGLLDQKTAKSGTVNEQIALDTLAPLECHAADEAILRENVCVNDFAFSAIHSSRDGVLAQIGAIEIRVELERIRERREQRSRIFSGQCELAMPRCYDR